MRFDAYLFDVQGTLLDFYTPVSSAVAGHLGEVGRLDVDPGDFTRAWRKDYFSRVSTLDQRSGAWQKVQGQYEAGFAAVAASYDLPAPDAVTAARVAASWQRLIPWPDVRDGLAAVRSGALTATLSNTDMATVIGLAKQLDLRFDAYFTAELFRRFKPDPQVYLGALDFLGVVPERAALVASHPYDLDAAAALGLGTVFVTRPDEYGDPTLAHTAEVGRYTQVVAEIGEVGDQTSDGHRRRVHAGAHGGQRKRHVGDVDDTELGEILVLGGRSDELQGEDAAAAVRCRRCPSAFPARSTRYGSPVQSHRDRGVDVAEHQASLLVDDLGVDGAAGADAGVGEGQLGCTDDLGAGGYRPVRFDRVARGRGGRDATIGRPRGATAAPEDLGLWSRSADDRHDRQGAAGSGRRNGGALETGI